MSDAPANPNATAKPVRAAERRAWVRYPPRRLEMLWQLFGMKLPEQRLATVQDISAQGIGLIVDRSFPPSSVLTLRFPGTMLDTRPFLVRVKYLQPLGNNQFHAGCTFVVPLTEEQLAELVVEQFPDNTSPKSP